jgi:hypothetical protein
MTEKVVDLLVQRGKEPHMDDIHMGAWDLQQALEAYLLENGQITNSDEVRGMSIRPPGRGEDEDYPMVTIHIQREAITHGNS